MYGPLGGGLRANFFGTKVPLYKCLKNLILLHWEEKMKESKA